MNTKLALTRFVLTLFLGILLCAGSLHAQENAEPRPPEGFTALFNGKNLSGWKGLVGNPETRTQMSDTELAVARKEANQRMRKHWKVVDGALEFDGEGKNTTLNLCTAKEYGDFELYIDWKILKAGDTGIYLRGSPQIQIWDTSFEDYWKNGADQGSGAIWNNKKNPRFPLVKADKPVGEWNTFFIRMVGSRVTVKLNDKLVVDDVVMENFWNRTQPIYARGSIELQNHSNLIWFRNIYLREIPAAEESR